MWFSKDKTDSPIVKFKYRIIMSNDKDWSYHIQKKGWILWTNVCRCATEHQARVEIKELAAKEYKKSKQVIFQYTHEDYLADKIKSK